MHMEAFLWMFLPVFVAGGSALLSFYIMQARMEVALAKERESLAEARATISSQRITMEERIKATEESTKRHSLDEFMQDFRVGAQLRPGEQVPDVGSQEHGDAGAAVFP